MAVPTIQTVCGVGCGSSLMLRMNVEKIAKANGYEIRAFCGDVGTCCANECDVIFISKELDNFMNKAEVEEKTLAYLESFAAEHGDA